MNNWNKTRHLYMYNLPLAISSTSCWLETALGSLGCELRLWNINKFIFITSQTWFWSLWAIDIYLTDTLRVKSMIIKELLKNIHIHIMFRSNWECTKRKLWNYSQRLWKTYYQCKFKCLNYQTILNFILSLFYICIY